MTPKSAGSADAAGRSRAADGVDDDQHHNEDDDEETESGNDGDDAADREYWHQTKHMVKVLLREPSERFFERLYARPDSGASETHQLTKNDRHNKERGT